MNPTDALIDAIKSGDDTRVKEILSNNPEAARARNEKGETPILVAAYRMRSDVVELLLGAGVEPDVYEASAIGDLERVQRFVSEDPALAGSYAKDGFTPLGLASFFGHKEVAAFLISSGADVNAQSKNEFAVMPLHSAAAGHHTAIVELLLDHGAFVNVVQHGGYTPLHTAANSGEEEAVRLLLAHGADVNARNSDGVTPLALAEQREHHAVAELLKRHGGVSS
jgi:ankyrin repeat protein